MILLHFYVSVIFYVSLMFVMLFAALWCMVKVIIIMVEVGRLIVNLIISINRLIVNQKIYLQDYYICVSSK